MVVAFGRFSLRDLIGLFIYHQSTIFPKIIPNQCANISRALAVVFGHVSVITLENCLFIIHPPYSQRSSQTNAPIPPDTCALIPARRRARDSIQRLRVSVSRSRNRPRIVPRSHVAPVRVTRYIHVIVPRLPGGLGGLGIFPVDGYFWHTHG